jgi:hypothetical protein
MNMFGLEGSGFIIAIGVCLLLVGAVVYYFNTRVASLEKALVRQNQVLTDFIHNVRSSHIEGRNTQMQVTDQSAGNVATPEALDAARDYFSSTLPQEKVDVSDEEDDFSDEDEESELDSEHESDTVMSHGGNVSCLNYNTDNINLEPTDVSQHVTNVDTMIVEITSALPLESDEVKSEQQIIELLDEDIEGDNFDNATHNVVKQEQHKDSKVIMLSDVKDLDEVSSSIGSSLDDEEEEEDDGVTIDSKQENVIADFSKLKVAKLKEIALKKGIKNANKMKKVELVAALESKK